MKLDLIDGLKLWESENINGFLFNVEKQHGRWIAYAGFRRWSISYWQGEGITLCNYAGMGGY